MSPSTPLDRSREPAPGPVRDFDFPPVTSSTLANGLGVRVATMSRLPLVSISMVLDAGEAGLPTGSAGLAVLSGGALDGGTQKRTGPELAEALEGIGSGLSVHTGWDSTTVSLTCLAERKEEAMALLAEALLQPAFPEPEVERLRNQRLAAIRQRRMDPGTMADDAAAHFFYADESPYHRPLAGTPESVAPLGPAEILAFVERHYHPGGSGLVVAGDVEVSEVKELAEAHFGSWKGAGEADLDVTVAPRFTERRILLVDRPGAVQSEIRIGQMGAARSTPHFFPLQVFNTVLGGAFTSRLMLNLREKQGFTYGVRSRLSLRRKAGPFSISAAVGTEVTAPAVREAFTELEGLISEGPTEDEVAGARDFIAGVFPLRLETAGQVSARIAELLVYGLPDDFFSSYRDRIREVTPEAARAAGQDVLRPGEMVVVVVGSVEGIRAPLEELELGPVEVVTPF